MKTTIIEIEPDGAHNENLLFLPLGRKIRGRFNWRRVREPLAMVQAGGWGGEFEIPGQRIGLNLESGEGFIIEPLHDPDHLALADKVKREGFALRPARETFKGVDVPTWLFWLKRAVDSGTARLVQGKLPDKIDGKPRLDFYGQKPPEDPRDKLITKLVDLVAGLLPADKRAELMASVQQ